MKNIININESSNNSTSSEECNENSVISITLPSDESYNGETGNTCVFKVSEDGKVIVNCKINESSIRKGNATIKEVITQGESSSKTDSVPKYESVLDMFENLPEDLSEIEISKILELLNRSELNEIGCGRILPYSVKLTESGDIKITLVIYNGGELPMALPHIPLKLVDGNESIIIADLVEINAEVSCGKIGIVETTVSKERLKEDNINLEQWEITFTME